MPLESGVVFVVPADRHVSITDSDINLQEDTHGRPKPWIDLLFSSAAEMYGDRLVAVVLTDTGSDGTDGARAIKKAGGTVIIQNPDTAAHPGMPRSLAPSAVDIIADLDKIGSIIHDLLRGIEVPAEPDKQRKLREFLEEVRDTNGIDFRSYKTPTIMRWLQHWIVGAPVEHARRPASGTGVSRTWSERLPGQELLPARARRGGTQCRREPRRGIRRERGRGRPEGDLRAGRESDNGRRALRPRAGDTVARR